tara:strand:+ start:1963 stop:4290 length:2328 start_codon:yes stop_codon:yes gene_type:complete
MVPFVIHAKDSGAPIRGLTAGVLQGMELRRQWEQDERLKLEQARQDEEWELNKKLIGTQQQAAELANEMAGLEIGHAKYLKELRQGAFDNGSSGLPPNRTVNIGPGQTGKVANISSGQKDAYNRLSKYDPDLALMDSWWQGIATDPEIVTWMEGFAQQDRRAQALFAAGEKYGGYTKAEWQKASVNELKALKKQAHGNLIGGWLADPRNHPTPETYERYFKGLHADNWTRYEAAYNKAKVDFENAAGDEKKLDEITLDLENAEAELFRAYASDKWWARVQGAYQNSGIEEKLETAMGTELFDMLDVDTGDGGSVTAYLDSGAANAKQKRAYSLWKEWHQRDQVGGSEKEHGERRELWAKMLAWDGGVDDVLKGYEVDIDSYKQIGEERQEMYENAVEYALNPILREDIGVAVQRTVDDFIKRHGKVEKENYPELMATLMDPNGGGLPPMGMEFYTGLIAQATGKPPSPGDGKGDLDTEDKPKRFAPTLHGDQRKGGDATTYTLTEYSKGSIKGLRSFDDFRAFNYGDDPSDHETKQDAEWLAGDAQIGYKEAGDWYSPFTIEKTYSPAIRLGVGIAEDLWDGILNDGTINSPEDLERHWKAALINEGVDPATVPKHMMDLSMRSTAIGTQMERITPLLVRDATAPKGEFSKWLAKHSREFTTAKQASRWLNANPQRQANVLQAVKNTAAHEGGGWLSRGFRKAGAMYTSGFKGAWSWLFDDEVHFDTNMNVYNSEWESAYKLIEAAHLSDQTVLPFGKDWTRPGSHWDRDGEGSK